MIEVHSLKLRRDINRSVVSAIYEYGIVNVPVIAEEVRLANESENVALEDLEHLVLGFAQLYQAPIEFDRSGFSGKVNSPVSAQNGGLIIEIVSSGELNEAA